MRKKFVNSIWTIVILFAMSIIALPVRAAVPDGYELTAVEPRVSYTRSTTKTVNNCVLTASIVYDGTTGKINRTTVTKSNNNVNIQYQYYITNNGYTCTFDIDIYIPGEFSPVGWNPTLNSPGPTR